MVVASILRLAGHGEHDDASYVAEELKTEPWAQDPVKVAERMIVERKFADAETMRQWRAEAAAQVEEAIATAQKEAAPVGREEDWCAIASRELVDQIS